MANFLFRTTFKFMLGRVIWPGFWILQTKFFRQISTQNCSNLLAIFFLHVTLMWKCHKQLWYPVQSSVHRRLVGRVGNSFCLLLCDGIFYKLLCGFARIWMVSKSKVLRNDVLWYIALGMHVFWFLCGRFFQVKYILHYFWKRRKNE